MKEIEAEKAKEEAEKAKAANKTATAEKTIRNNRISVVKKMPILPLAHA